ncbi:MAG: leucine-rich repeat protein [Lachnoclostridium sp.]|nr:leucine-rich repeat protein [Lachnoclostridium sp.]
MSGKCGKNVRWTLDNGVLVISGEGPMDNYGNEAPWRNAMVESVIIEDGVTTIGNNCLKKSKISSLEIPSSVVRIGTSAFSNCEYLSKITFSYGLQVIDQKAFEGCESLTEVIIPSSVNLIAPYAFNKCKQLISITIPKNVSLGRNVFSNCNNLVKAGELPSFVTAENSINFGIPYHVVEHMKKVDSLVAENNNNNTPSQNNDVGKVKSPKQKVSENVTTIEYGQSDVDKNVPCRPQVNEKTFAIIFANENYQTLNNVPFAENDGKSFYNYCLNVLGIPEENITYTPDATVGSMKAALAYMKDIDEAFKGNLSFILYYAGHGAPDDATKAAYLVPVDAYTISKDVCLPLDDLYADLGKMRSKSIKVFLDACFSGSTRTSEMVAEGRTVVVAPKKSTVSGNLLVISAASAEQTAWQYDRQGHGLFTYYLLKKLRETSGEVTMGELVDYLSENVAQRSVVVNRKKQSPAILSSPTLGQKWRTWTMK